MRSSGMSKTCAKPVYAPTYKRRIRVSFSHTNPAFGVHMEHKTLTYPTMVRFLPIASTTFCAQLFEHINRSFYRLIPIFHRPYKNKDFLNIYNSIIERQAV